MTRKELKKITLGQPVTSRIRTLATGYVVHCVSQPASSASYPMIHGDTTYKADRELTVKKLISCMEGRSQGLGMI